MKKIQAALIVALLLLALPALAGHVDDGGTDEAWSNEMNQESYWEGRFGAECTKFENHSGWIPSQYDAAVVKDGNMVRVYDPAPSPFFALGAVNPANGKHFKAPHSWVMKCDKQTTTTTTQPTTTTTEQETTTTTEQETTTTTEQPTTTTTEQESTTTTEQESTTSTTETETTTSQPTVTKETLPFTDRLEISEWVTVGLSGLAGGLLLLVAAKLVARRVRIG